MSKRAFSVIAIAGLIGCMAAEGKPQTLSGRDIIAKMEEVREGGDDSSSVVAMELVSKRGAVTRRKIVTYRKKYGEEYKALIFFLEPADVEGTGFLVWTHDNADDDQWLWLPALGRVRQISASARGQSFMGTDFSYEDMGDIDVEKREHALRGEETVEGERCYKVESIPKKPETYGRIDSWVSKETFLPVRVDFYDTKRKLLKVGKFSDVKIIEGIPTNLWIGMENVQTGHKTTLTFTEVKYNTGLSDDLFTERYLKRGRP